MPPLFGQQPGRAVNAPVVASTSCLTSGMRLTEARASQAASSAVVALHTAGMPCPPRVSTASNASLYSRSAASSSTHAEQGRWLDLLGEFDITIQHRPGRIHGNSDVLSRRRRTCERADQPECRQCVRRSSEPVGTPVIGKSVRARQMDPHTVNIDETDPSGVESAAHQMADNSPHVQVINAKSEDGETGTLICLDDIRKAQSSDDNIRSVLDHYKTGKPTDYEEIRQYPEEPRVLFAHWDSLLVEDGVLYRRFHHPDRSTKFLQIVLPGIRRKK